MNSAFHTTKSAMMKLQRNGIPRLTGAVGGDAAGTNPAWRIRSIRRAGFRTHQKMIPDG
jgi:hypothetical protein